VTISKFVIPNSPPYFNPSLQDFTLSIGEKITY